MALYQDQARWDDPSGGDSVVPCRREPERFFPDIDAATTSRQRRRLYRTVLPGIRAVCDGCFFRIPCAIGALENREIAGVWAGVLVRPYTSPRTAHRKQLLAILADHVTQAAPTPENMKLHDRISLMLSRRPELRPGFGAAVRRAYMGGERTGTSASAAAHTTSASAA